MRKKACLFAALASLNNGHSSDLRACCVGMRFSSRPNLVPTRPLCLHSAAWRSSLIANLSSTALRHAPIIGAEACVVASCCHVTAITLACNLIWPYNSFVLNHCTNSFSVSPSLALKLVRRRLSLRSSYLGMSTRVSIARLTTWRMFLVITVIHSGSFGDVALVMIASTASRSINWLTARLPMAMRDVMFSMVASMRVNR